MYFRQMKSWIGLFILMLSGCIVNSEEAQKHNNLIMVAQERVVNAFYQCDSSLTDSTGYRMLYWEYDSIQWNLQQMTQLLDTIYCPDDDSSLKCAARDFIASSATLREQDYPLFLDAYRKYQALGSKEDSLVMIQYWLSISQKKEKIISDFRLKQKDYFDEYNLVEHTLH